MNVGSSASRCATTADEERNGRMAETEATETADAAEADVSRMERSSRLAARFTVVVGVVVGVAVVPVL